MKIIENLNITKVGDRYYIYPFDNNGDMCAMNETSKYIIDRFSAGSSPNEVAKDISAKFGVDLDIVSKDIQTLVEILYEKGIAYD